MNATATVPSESAPLTPDAFRAALLAKGDYYHIHHPYQVDMAEGRRDVEHGLELVLAVCTTYPAQQRALEILQFKLDVLWSMLDAMTLAYQLGRPPYHSVTERRVYHRGLT